jgi:hypothetical protein
MRLQDLYPEITANMKQSKILKYYQRYLDVVTDQLARNAFLFSGDNNYHVQRSLNMELIHQRCSSFMVRGQRYYVFKIFNQIDPLINIIERGNNFSNQLSVGRIVNPDRIQQIVNKTMTNEQIIQWAYQSIKSDFGSYQLVPIDQAAVKLAIKRADKPLPTDTPAMTRSIQAVRGSLENILQLTQAIAAEFGYSAILHYEKVSEFGRTYYTGFNLQNQPKLARQFALGRHWQYDINTCVFDSDKFIRCKAPTVKVAVLPVPD